MPSSHMLSSNEIKFIADDILGRLAKWLRIFGYDVVYYHFIEDKDLIQIAVTQERILLTRDTDIVSSILPCRFIFIESHEYGEQLVQVFRLLSLKPDKQKVFSRCLICNLTLNSILKENVKGKVPPFVFETQNEFVSCMKCNKIYWKGTHNSRVEQIIEKFITFD
jgi:uncharacterized protein